jgi:RNA recognition motif-containing protein
LANILSKFEIETFISGKIDQISSSSSNSSSSSRVREDVCRRINQSSFVFYFYPVMEISDEVLIGEVPKRRTSIFIGNLSKNTEPLEIRCLFESFNIIVSYVDMKFNYAFVHCDWSDSLQDIVANMKGMRTRLSLPFGDL